MDDVVTVDGWTTVVFFLSNGFWQERSHSLLDSTCSSERMLSFPKCSWLRISLIEMSNGLFILVSEINCSNFCEMSARSFAAVRKPIKVAFYNKREKLGSISWSLQERDPQISICINNTGCPKNTALRDKIIYIWFGWNYGKMSCLILPSSTSSSSSSSCKGGWSLSTKLSRLWIRPGDFCRLYKVGEELANWVRVRQYGLELDRWGLMADPWGEGGAGGMASWLIVNDPKSSALSAALVLKMEESRECPEMSEVAVEMVGPVLLNNESSVVGLFDLFLLLLLLLLQLWMERGRGLVVCWSVCRKLRMQALNRSNESKVWSVADPEVSTGSRSKRRRGGEWIMSTEANEW